MAIESRVSLLPQKNVLTEACLTMCKKVLNIERTLSIEIENSHKNFSLINGMTYYNEKSFCMPRLIIPAGSRKTAINFPARLKTKGMLCYEISGEKGRAGQPLYLQIGWKLKHMGSKAYFLKVVERKSPPLYCDQKTQKLVFKSAQKGTLVDTMHPIILPSTSIPNPYHFKISASTTWRKCDYYDKISEYLIDLLESSLSPHSEIAALQTSDPLMEATSRLINN
ncbi:hypothetical protein G9A89_015838 [Geosiphon pyriformis]|nr:hypothetical protein G9A89_015838 [Geosiphon pyriformis]